MSDEEIRRIQLQWVLSWIIVSHCLRQRQLNRISMACAYLTKKGILRRVARGKYEAVKKS